MKFFRRAPTTKNLPVTSDRHREKKAISLQQEGRVGQMSSLQNTAFSTGLLLELLYNRRSDDTTLGKYCGAGTVSFGSSSWKRKEGQLSAGICRRGTGELQEQVSVKVGFSVLGF